MFGGLECVAADLDGTLLGPDELPGEADRAAVRALSAAGIRVVAVTGRHPHIAEWPVRLAGCHPAAICMNGAAVYDFAAGAYRAVEYMPGEEAYRACRLLDRLGAPYAAYAADAILLAGAWEAGNFYEAYFSRCGSRFRHKPVYCRDSADFGGREIADLLLPGVPSEAAEALRALAGRMGCGWSRRAEAASTSAAQAFPRARPCGNTAAGRGFPSRGPSRWGTRKTTVPCWKSADIPSCRRARRSRAGCRARA